ncbi:SAM-dependent methyltransferase [Paenibacillus baekrokdamisoli]|uniref:SAM-dependent methyltransferase n=1 Tax=Paenibacillus baekrokdamisoli TaxID=1712516 RepID=A0A3G9J1M2_9BACL|nr:class I SAM-dependent methyltransferase [Paenibacillus baekrokdamisoli]MBB3071507.1 tRNA (cmo5U34)-methyltransferase [Paenibacillus baekrokdamisoli]BBH24462.1 SAM-dependent methyltransferase [Paenibacillus baekrokdamisoli]
MEIRDEVRRNFDKVAQEYDGQRRKLIPCFDDFYQAGVSMAESNTISPTILDLGAGTGLFSSLLLQRYPGAKVTLIDISEKMMEVTRLRLQGFNTITYVVDDYTNYTSSEKFDIIISALSIHHLSDADKLKLYNNTYSNLKDTGVFINADQVLGHTPFIESLYKEDWRNKVEVSGLSRDELDSAYERTQLDRMAPLHTQLDWLQQIGFSDVDVVYKYFNFVVLYGRKSI